jgi:hypothetical protein
MTNPLLVITNAGRGETPACPNAAYKPGDVVKVRRTRALSEWPAELVVLKAIPPGFPADYALADLVGEPRPLMIRAPRRCITYICCEAIGDEKTPTAPYVAKESDLQPSGKPALDIGTVTREGAA